MQLLKCGTKKCSIRHCLLFSGQARMEALKQLYEAMPAQGCKILLINGKFCPPSSLLGLVQESLCNSLLPGSVKPGKGYRANDSKRQFTTIHLRRLTKAYLAGIFQIYCIWEFIIRQQCQVLKVKLVNACTVL